MNFDGYIDALSNNGDTITLAVELLLPFYQLGSDFAWSYMPWIFVFATAFSATKLSAGQAKGADLLRPASIMAAIAICLIPLPKSVTGLNGTFGLGPYITYSVTQDFNALVQETVQDAQTSMTRGTPVPLSALSTMNQQYSQIFKGSEVEPLLQDYWGNCTNGVVNFDDFSKKHWLSVGLLGPGLLGLQSDDIDSSGKYLSSLLEDNAGEQSELLGWWDWGSSGTNWDNIRREVAPALERRGFPNGTGRSYKIPTAEYWKYQLSEDPEEPLSRSGYMSLESDEFSAQQRSNYMKIEELEYSRRNAGARPPGWDPERFYAYDCLDLFSLAHMAMRHYYQGIKGQYSVPEMGDADDHDFADFERASSTTAYMGALNTYYENSASRRLNDVQNSAARNGLDADQGFFASLGDQILVDSQGVMQKVTTFLLGLNLDQWVLALLGSMALGIAFLLVFLPFFVPFAFFSSSGDNSVAVILKVILMFQLTLSLGYVVTSIGATCMAVVNAYASSDYNNGGISTTSVAALAIAINTGCLLFPLYIARLSYMMLFGSVGVSPADGQTISVGRQAALTAMTAIIAKKLFRGSRGQAPQNPRTPPPQGTPGNNYGAGPAGGAGPKSGLPSAPSQGGGPRQYGGVQRSLGISQARLQGPKGFSDGRTSSPGKGKTKYMNPNRKGETFDVRPEKPEPKENDDPKGDR